MIDAHQLGKKGEDIAVNYLINKGYQIIERNWRSGHKEIDIIALMDDVLAIVEVKTRKNNNYGEPDNAVGKAKQRMLIWAADAYVRNKNLNVSVRFDIISILVNDVELEIEHIEDAFICTLSR